MFLFLCFSLPYISPRSTQQRQGKCQNLEEVLGNPRERRLEASKILYAPKLSSTEQRFEKEQFTSLAFSEQVSLWHLPLLFFLNFFSSCFLCKYISPAPHFMLYYSQIANVLGPLIHLWRMHFEAKLNTLKWLVHGVLILGISEKH